MGVIGSLYKKICLLSPWIEVTLRKLYWNNVNYLKRFSPYGSGGVENARPKKKVDFEEIVAYIKSMGVEDGALIVVHSSYDTLSCTGYKPQEIIQKLRDIVGETGTIAMPAIRHFKEEPHGADLLTANYDNVVCEYNVMRTPISSGLLPLTLLRTKGSVCSHFPLNPLVAIGPLAKEMMEHNIDSEKSSAHGKGSCWKFCMDHNAIILGLGVDLEHHNTMCHVMEEAFDGWKWSDEEWYHDRWFDIVDENKNQKRIKVRERNHQWGMIHIAELHLATMLYKNGIIQRKMFGELPVCVEKSQKLRDFLQSKNKNGFPYYKR